VVTRSRDAATRKWTRIGTAAPCATKALAPKQLHLMPPTTMPKATSVELHIAPEQQEGSVEVTYRLANSTAAWLTMRVAGPPFHLTGLAPDSAYYVKAALVVSADTVGPISDPTVHRTASSQWESLDMFRISEKCGEDCEVDFLYDHDAGDLLSDVDFITHVANSSAFDIIFNTSVITKYCVERTAVAFADYVSCNGPDAEHYTCLCNNWIDRCIGRLDLSPCPDQMHEPCKCSDESLARSSQFVGRMPVYAPFPNVHASNGSCPALPVEQSTFLGYWYSFPAQAECAPSSLGGWKRRSNRTGSCSWGRHASQRLVRGEALVSLGFNLSVACDVPQLVHNRDVIEHALAEHPSRCCGC